MSIPLADLLFWVSAIAVAVAQLMILRSTHGGMRRTPGAAHRAREWSYALLPALALAVVLVLTWRTMHPAVLRTETRTAATSLSS